MRAATASTSSNPWLRGVRGVSGLSFEMCSCACCMCVRGVCARARIMGVFFSCVLSVYVSSESEMYYAVGITRNVSN